MKTYLLSFMMALVVLSCKKTADVNGIYSAQKSEARSSFQLVWADEFNYSGLPDSNFWTYETGFVRNNESQYYVAKRLANSKVQNGSLIITAQNDNYKNHPITSASIITKGKLDFLEGKIEVRARMPAGAGAWPAIWTLGINRDTIGWPFCGEIDIVEWLGFAPQFISGSLYTAGSKGQTISRVTPYFPRDNTLSSRYHVYSIEWEDSEIKYFFDNINYATYHSSELSTKEWRPFTKPHYLLLNLALGGTSGGPINYSKFPFIYKIDYVRYYKKVN
jgi:beta-glucanase (GH16 family)